MSKSMFLALALVLAGCSKPAATPGPQEPAKAEQPAAAPAAAAASTSASTPAQASAPGDDNPSAPAATIALDGGGLRIISIPSGSSHALAFGSAKTDTLNTLQAIEGAPLSQGENIDCRATRAEWADGLTVWFARGKFVGWSVGKADSSLSTMGGLRLGATRAEVENGAAVAKIAPSSLGEEFTVGDIAGLLDSKRPDAKVTNLWAGSVCIAR